MTHRASALHETMITRSGLSEGINVTMGVRKPLDHLELVDYLQMDMGPMLDAQAVIWMTGDEALITAASVVVLSAGNVISKSTTLPEDRRSEENQSFRDRVKGQVQGLRQLQRDPEVEAARIVALRELGRNCWTFGQVMRARLGVADVEALLRAFPGFRDALDTNVPSSETEPTHAVGSVIANDDH